MRRSFADLIADDAELKSIEIPAAAENGTQLFVLLGSVSYFDKIIGWEIIGNSAAFRAARQPSMNTPRIPIDADAGWAPPLGRSALKKWYVRAETGAAFPAVLVLYLASEKAKT